jgi:hypothetical protein
MIPIRYPPDRSALSLTKLRLQCTGFRDNVSLQVLAVDSPVVPARDMNSSSNLQFYCLC